MRLLLAFILSAVSVFAETLYVTQSGAGSADGSTLGNAWSVSQLNTSGNWGVGAGKVSAGDTVSINGTITSAVTVQGSGSSGSPITLLFASGAKFSAAAWAGTGAIAVGNKSYITIDGGTNGIMENTANGTGLGNAVDTSMIVAASANNFTVQNLTIRNVYVRTIGTEANGYGSGIEQTGTYTAFTVDHCTISNCYIGINARYDGTCTNLLWTNNTITKCNWGCKWGDAGAGASADGIVMYGNNISDCANWDDTASNSFHHNGVYLWAENGGSLRNATFYNNTFGPTWGDHTTGGIFMSGDVAGILIYNNIFLCNTADAPANGLMMIWPHSGTGTGNRIYNNTLIGGGVGRGIELYEGNGSGTTTFDVKNNLVLNMGTSIARFINGSSTLTADYNLSYGMTGGQEFSDSNDSSAGFLTYSQWQSAGKDTHGVNASPVLVSTSDFHLQSSSPAKDSGTSEAAYFTVDRDANARPQGSAWDIGAYEYVSGAVNPVQRYVRGAIGGRLGL